MAGAFASIVGLICNFRSERNVTDRLDTNEFLSWLETLGHHQQIKNLIESNQGISSGIEEILNENIEVLLEKLNKIDNALASYASQFDTFKNLASAIKPNSRISPQAISILKQIEQEKTSGFVKIETNDGVLLMNNEGDIIEYDEPRFIEDDLFNLVDLSFLHRSQLDSKQEAYKITRNAIDYINLAAH